MVVNSATKVVKNSTCLTRDPGLISSCKGKQTYLIRYRTKDSSDPCHMEVECLHGHHMCTHFAANSIIQTCRLPTISSKQFACLIQCNYYIFCWPIQTGRLECQVSLQDNNCLRQFRFSRHERYTVQQAPILDNQHRKHSLISLLYIIFKHQFIYWNIKCDIMWQGSHVWK